ncbi:hypothetical protein JTB14_011662 [Gonioctena quinquepunctata]|nr:hypothetical protein JTB14_011662 [Gonioctena quinquepunctata]
MNSLEMGRIKVDNDEDEEDTKKQTDSSATIKTQTKDYQARVKIEGNQISLFGGVICPFLPGYCFDTTLGKSVWKSYTQISCEVYCIKSKRISETWKSCIWTIHRRGPKEYTANGTSSSNQLIQEEGGHILGEALYIMRCLSKTAVIRRTDKCYHELPIEINIRSKFMASVTRILQVYAEEIDCNGLISPLYFMDNE